MGSEIDCVMSCGKNVVRGTALLETNEIVFRGALRVVLPLKEIVRAEASDGVLVVRHDGNDYKFKLGDHAAKWEHKIKNPKSRLDKLGVKDGAAVCVVALSDAALDTELASKSVRHVKKGADLVFFGANESRDLARVPKLKKMLAKTGALWVVRPKGVKAITERETMAAAKKAGLVDVKVVAFSETHTAEKFVIPVKDR